MGIDSSNDVEDGQLGDRAGVRCLSRAFGGIRSQRFIRCSLCTLQTVCSGCSLQQRTQEGSFACHPGELHPLVATGDRTKQRVCMCVCSCDGCLPGCRRARYLSGHDHMDTRQKTVEDSSSTGWRNSEQTLKTIDKFRKQLNSVHLAIIMSTSPKTPALDEKSKAQMCFSFEKADRPKQP